MLVEDDRGSLAAEQLNLSDRKGANGGYFVGYSHPGLPLACGFVVLSPLLNAI